MALYKSHGAESPDIRIPVSRQSWIELARNTAVDFPRISTPVAAPRISVSCNEHAGPRGRPRRRPRIMGAAAIAQDGIVQKPWRGIAGYPDSGVAAILDRVGATPESGY